MTKIKLNIIFLLALVGCSGGSGGAASSGSASNGDGLTIGAHYYVWYQQNFKQGYLRGELAPAQEPFAGEYNSSSSVVASEQIRLAAENGINFFTLDWWPSRPGQNSAIDKGFLSAPNLSQIRFCIFYETLDLGFDESNLTTTIDDNARETFVQNMVDIGDRYFANPQYLRINNRPVVFFYATRTLSGQYAQMFKDARTELGRRGYEVYFVGDEIYWVNTVDTPDGPQIESEPNSDRIKLFDAITAYNTYAPSFTSHSGYAVNSAHLVDTESLYQAYRAAAGDVAIIPGVIPGYNDRGHRLDLDHYVIPRQFAPGQGPETLLQEYFRRIAVPFADSNLKMAVITSWNEWNEDTAIEPIAPASETTADISGDDNYTQGYAYGGVGDEALKAVREFSSAN